MVDTDVRQLAPSPPLVPPLRERFWFQSLVVVLAVVAFVAVVAHVVRGDVVAGWQVVATCPAAAGASPAVVTTSVDASACAAAPTRRATSHGWPVVPVALPASAGLDPRITRVLSDRQARTFRLEYAVASSASEPSGGTVLVFVEVPPGSVPDAPFTIEGSTGPVTVTIVPAT